MTDYVPLAQRERLSLSDRLDKLHRMCLLQCDEYASLHASGSMTVEQRIKGEAEVEDVWVFFKLAVEYPDALKAAHAARLAVDRAEADRIAAADPVSAVLDAFPGARVTHDTAQSEAFR